MKLKNSEIIKIVKAVILIPKTSVEISISTQVKLAMVKKILWPVYEGVEKFNEMKIPRLDEFRGKFRKAKDDAERESLTSDYADAIEAEKKRMSDIEAYLKEETELESKLPVIFSTDFNGTLKDEVSKTVIEYLFPVFSDMNPEGV